MDTTYDFCYVSEVLTAPSQPHRRTHNGVETMDDAYVFHIITNPTFPAYGIINVVNRTLNIHQSSPPFFSKEGGHDRLGPKPRNKTTAGVFEKVFSMIESSTLPEKWTRWDHMMTGLIELVDFKRSYSPKIETVSSDVQRMTDIIGKLIGVIPSKDGPCPACIELCTDRICGLCDDDPRYPPHIYRIVLTNNAMELYGPIFSWRAANKLFTHLDSYDLLPEEERHTFAKCLAESGLAANENAERADVLLELTPPNDPLWMPWRKKVLRLLFGVTDPPSPVAPKTYTN